MKRKKKDHANSACFSQLFSSASLLLVQLLVLFPPQHYLEEPFNILVGQCY